METVNSTSTTHTYQYGNAQWRDLLTAYDGDAITYDAGGNPLTYRDGITFTWKNGRQLASYEDSTYRITYDYNDSGIRVKKTVTEKSTGTVTVTENYLEGANIIAQKITTTPSGGTASTEMIWYIYDGTGTVVGMQTEDGNFYFEKNLQGDITSIINESGIEVVSYCYDAWGNVISAEDTSGVQLVEKNPFTYRGYYRDNETGFYYLQSRYYDAEVGRFVNADTTEVLHNSSGISDKNVYAYCGNDSVNNIDPNGTAKVKTNRLAIVLDIALSIACFYGAVTYSAIGTGLKIAYKTVGRNVIKRLIKNKTIKSLLKAIAKSIRSINKVVRKYLHLAVSTIKENLVSILIGRILSRWNAGKTNTIMLLCSLGGLIALLMDAGDGKYDGYVRFK